MAKAKTETETKPKGIKAWKVTISGSYRNAKKERFDFQDIVGYVPYVDEELMKQAVIKRYAPMWVAKDKSTKESVQGVRTVYIDDAVPATADFSFIGKNIKDMTMEELQDMAVANDLKSIPLFRKTGLREMQNVSYAAYALHVKKVQQEDKSKEAEKKWKLLTDHRTEGFNIAKNPPIIVGSKTRRDTSEKLTNEEIIEAQQDGDPKQRFTLPELKKLADMRNISYPKNVGFEALYDILYGKGEAA